MRNKQLQERIIGALGQKPFLTVAELEKHINRSGKQEYSAKAFYKELRLLRENGVVVTTQRKHALRLPWVLETLSFSEILERNYVNHPSLPGLNSLERKWVWRFGDLLTMNDFWSHLLLVLIQQSKKKVLLGWNPHPWFHLVQTKQEEQYVRALKRARSKLHLIVGGNTYLDRWAEQFWDKGVVEYSFGKSPFEKERSTYVNVIDDYVITVKLDPKVAAEIDRIYAETRSLDTLDLPGILSLFRNKTRVMIRLEKNALKAKKIKTKFKRYWGINFE